MFTRVPRLALSLTLVALAISATASAQTAAAPAGPVIVVETSKGVFEFETYPVEAPKTVARIVELVKQRFYNGMRIHRVVPGFVIQMGDPQTRDMTKKAAWGTGGSGKPIGVAEISKTRLHVKGAVAMAHAGDPAQGRQPVLRHAGAGGASQRAVHGVRQGHQRHGCRREDRGGRSHRAHDRQVDGEPSSHGNRATSAEGNGEGTGLFSCRRNWTALATPCAEK